MINPKSMAVENPLKRLVGLIVSVYSSSFYQGSSLIDLAWIVSALSYTSALKKNDPRVKALEGRIRDFRPDDGDRFTVQEATGLIVGLKALLHLGLYDDIKLTNFRGYFEKVSKTDWFRVKEVAGLFCFAFSTQTAFDDLVKTASDYLERELKKSQPPIGITLFGLSQTKSIDGLIDPKVEMEIRRLLNSQRQSIEELSYLCLALRESSKDNLKSEAQDRLQYQVFDYLPEVTSGNSELISLIMTVLFISNSEADETKILEKLKRTSIDQETKDRVLGVAKSGENLVINFRDANPLPPPVFKTLSIALYSISNLPLSKVFLFDPDLKENVENYLKTTQKKRFRVVTRKSLAMLLIVFNAFLVFVAVKYWWPLFDVLTKMIELMPTGLKKTTIQSLSWAAFLYPFYMALNFNICIATKGWVTARELFASQTPETFINKVKDLRKK